MNHLSNIFYTSPRFANTTMTTKQLKETLLHTEGFIVACGRCWNVKSESLGAGVYKVWLTNKYDEEVGK